MATLQRQPFEQVARPWADLARGASPNPFLHPLWHRILHELASEHLGLETLALGPSGAPHALATVGRTRVTRSGVFRPHQLRLNETGDPVMDRLTVEHNAPLAPSGQEGRALAGLLAGLLEERDWDELATGWVDEQRWGDWWPEIEPLPLAPLALERRPYLFRDLGADDRDPEQLLSGISRNTRSQVRRAIRSYGGASALKLQVAEDPEQAEAWLAEMVQLHQERWRERGKSGAFADGFMRDFHRRLVREGAGEGYARMVRLEAEGGLLGYLYNLRVGPYECNYQSGLVYEPDNKRKPGLVAHVLAMASAAGDGVRRYDFLMGDSQYKRSLASGQGMMVRMALQRRRPVLWLERQLRRLRDRSQPPR